MNLYNLPRPKSVKAILSGKKTPGTPPVPHLTENTSQTPMTDMGTKSEEPNKLHLDTSSPDPTFEHENAPSPAEDTVPLPTQEEMFERQLQDTPNDPDLLGVIADYHEERGDPRYQEYRDRAADIDPLSGQPGYRADRLRSALNTLVQDFGDRHADEFRAAVDNQDEETIHDFLNVLEKVYGGRHSMQFHPRGKRVLKWIQEMEKWFPRQKALFPGTGISVKDFYRLPSKKSLSKVLRRKKAFPDEDLNPDATVPESHSEEIPTEEPTVETTEVAPLPDMPPVEPIQDESTEWDTDEEEDFDRYSYVDDDDYMQDDPYSKPSKQQKPSVLQRTIFGYYSEDSIKAMSGTSAFRSLGFQSNTEIVPDGVRALYLTTTSPVLEGLSQTLRVDNNDVPYLYNDSVYFNPQYRRMKIGTQFAAASAKAAQDIGCSRVELHAVGDFESASSGKNNGYATWAALGWSCPVEELRNVDEIRRAFPHAKELLDVIESPRANMPKDWNFKRAHEDLNAFLEQIKQPPTDPDFLTGREWWMYFGVEFGGVLDLSPGSRGLKLLKRKLAAVKKQTPRGSKAMNPKREMPEGWSDSGWWMEDLGEDLTEAREEAYRQLGMTGKKAIDPVPTEEPDDSDTHVAPLSDPIDPIEPVQQVESVDNPSSPYEEGTPAYDDTDVPSQAVYDEPEPQRMSEQQQWEETLKNDPDPTTFLVYADWLEEQGNPNADIIRGMAEGSLTQEQWDRMGNVGDDLEPIVKEWVVRTYPNIENIASQLGLSMDNAAKVSHLITHREFGGEELEPDEVMKAINQIMGGFGVESQALEGTGDYNRSGMSYVNTGDTYSPTIIYDEDADTFELGSWGGWYEEEEQDYEEETGRRRHPYHGEWYDPAATQLSVLVKDEEGYEDWEEVDDVPPELQGQIEDILNEAREDEGTVEYEGQTYRWQRGW